MAVFHWAAAGFYEREEEEEEVRNKVCGGSSMDRCVWISTMLLRFSVDPTASHFQKIARHLMNRRKKKDATAEQQPTCG